MTSHISEIIPVNNESPFTEQEPLGRFVSLPPGAHVVGAISVYSAFSERPGVTEISSTIMRPPVEGTWQSSVSDSLLNGYDALARSQTETLDPTLEQFGDQALNYASEMMGKDRRHLLSGLVAFETTDEETEVHNLRTVPFFSRTAEIFIVAQAKRIEAEPPLPQGRHIRPEISAQLIAQEAQLKAQYELMFSKRNGELRREKVFEAMQWLNTTHLETAVARLSQLSVQSEEARINVAWQQPVEPRGILEPALAANF